MWLCSVTLCMFTFLLGFGGSVYVGCIVQMSPYVLAWWGTCVHLALSNMHFVRELLFSLIYFINCTRRNRKFVRIVINFRLIQQEKWPPLTLLRNIDL